MRESAEYRLALAESTRHHAESKTFSGRFLRPHGPVIKSIIERLGCKTILDYGCGKGEQYTWIIPERGETLEEYWGIEVRKFDPAYPPFAAEPEGTFDLVICTHVLGSIPVVDLPWVVDRLYGLASKALYVAEKIGPVKKKVFTRPEAMPIGWSEDQWHAALARETEIETHFVARVREDGGKPTRHYQLCGSRFLAVGGMAPTLLPSYSPKATMSGSTR